MRTPSVRAIPATLALLVVLLILHPSSFIPCSADDTRQQTIQLREGWNAVFLAVEPTDNTPAAVFAGASVELALTHYSPLSPAQFIADVDEIDWKKSGWYRWIPADKPEAVWTNLRGLSANRPYLIKCSTAHTLEIVGRPSVAKPKWQPDAFNFVGFHVADGTGQGPTFAQWFEGSSAHRDARFYALDGDCWKRVAAPANANIASGTAYWVWCEGGSEHPGPVHVKLPGVGDELTFPPEANDVPVEITNRSPNPLTVTVEQVPGGSANVGGGLWTATRDQALMPLSRVTYDPVDGTGYEPFTSVTETIEAGQTVTVKLAIRQLDIEEPSITGLLKISDDLGNVIYAPMRAEKL